MTDLYSNKTLTAFFDQKDDASLAVQRLQDLGIPETSIRLLGGQGAQKAASTGKRVFGKAWVDMFFPDEDRETYGERLRRGGYLVTVTDLGPPDSTKLPTSSMMRARSISRSGQLHGGPRDGRGVAGTSRLLRRARLRKLQVLA